MINAFMIKVSLMNKLLNTLPLVEGAYSYTSALPVPSHIVKPKYAIDHDY